MKDKKRYYALDEVGFVGTQVIGSKKVSEKDIRDTVKYIKSKKPSNNSVNHNKKFTTALKISE